jgi:Outer membrane protein beta-barrel domain
MKSFILLFLGTLLLAITPSVQAQDTNSRVEAGVFVQDFRLNGFNGGTQDFGGIGFRGALDFNQNAAFEAEFARDFSRTYNDTQFHTWHGLFGPKLQTSGPFSVFVTAKLGFDHFTANGFGKTDFALYPGGGVQWFPAQHFGIRAEVGDEVYFDNGAHNNLKVSFGPQIKW